MKSLVFKAGKLFANSGLQLKAYLVNRVKGRVSFVYVNTDAKAAAYKFVLHQSLTSLAIMLLAILIYFISGMDTGILIYGIIISLTVFFIYEKELDRKVKRKKSNLYNSFPDFISSIAILINAGMNIQRAWERTVVYTGKDTDLYHEADLVIEQIKKGVPEYKAYEYFAKRCGIPEISRFVSILMQNVKKGSDELVPVIRMFINECRIVRKSNAHKKGEEASAAMLVPLMLMLLSVLVIVSAPAILMISLF